MNYALDVLLKELRVREDELALYKYSRMGQLDFDDMEEKITQLNSAIRLLADAINEYEL